MTSKRTQLWASGAEPSRDPPLHSQVVARARDGAICPECGATFSERPFCLRDGTLAVSSLPIGDRYVVDERLGAGGAAFVFGGRHKALGKTVAVKILRPELASDSKHAQRFLREAQLASNLQHENIVNVSDVGNDDALGLPFLVMDRLRGPTLAAALRSQGVFGWEPAVAILAQLARALTFAHGEGVIHRDLTPRNVILESFSGRANVVKLCDFGLSRLTTSDERLTMTGQLVGTPAYVSPEQVQGNANHDARVDIYALGVIAYELLTGALPHVGTTPVALLASKLRDPARPLHQVRPDIDCPPVLEELVMRCLRTNPAERPSSASEVEEVLVSVSATVTAPRPPVAIATGRKIGSYEVRELLGTGGVGSVYRATHPILGTDVAIKVLLPEMARIPEVVDRFIQEARASSAIGSPHIARYFDFGHLEDGRAYAVMDYYKGSTIDAHVEKHGPMAVEDTARVLMQVAAALGQAHTAGIVHRDLKPENIMITRDASGAPDVKVLDFGIAKMLSPTGSSLKTQVGLFVGTPSYCAPEQIGNGNIGPAADIYAFGATAFHMLTGRPPFEGELQDIFYRKATSEAPPVTAMRSDISPRVAADIAKMLARDAAARFASMDDIRIALQGWSHAHDVEPIGVGDGIPGAERAPKKLIAASLAIALLAGGGAAVFFAPRGEVAPRGADIVPLVADTPVTAPSPGAPSPVPPSPTSDVPAEVAPAAPPSPPVNEEARVTAETRTSASPNASHSRRVTRPGTRPGRPGSPRPLVPAAPQRGAGPVIADPFGP